MTTSISGNKISSPSEKYLETPLGTFEMVNWDLSGLTTENLEVDDDTTNQVRSVATRSLGAVNAEVVYRTKTGGRSHRLTEYRPSSRVPRAPIVVDVIDGGAPVIEPHIDSDGALRMRKQPQELSKIKVAPGIYSRNTNF